MDERFKQVLELFAQPAFLVENGVVCWHNSAAHALLADGTPLEAFLEGDGALFALWDRSGVLRLPLLLSGEEYDAAVRSTQYGDLFVAARRTAEQNTTAAALVNASAALRKPLQQLVTASTELFENASELPEASAALNRSVYQLLRLCNQMSDGGMLILRRREFHRVPTNLTLFLRTFANEVRPLAESAGLCFRFTEPEGPVRGDVDGKLLERALYNLLSNAMNYTPRGGTITLSAEKQGYFLLIHVSDTGTGISKDAASNLFDRFSEHPLGDPRRGIGLGLPMVREIARLHGGTISAGDTEDGGTRVTFSVSLEPTPLELRSRGIELDYCYGRHHGLVELADVLSAAMYDPNQVL